MTLSYHPLDTQTAHIVHFIFEWLGVLTGVQTYRWLKKRQSPTGSSGLLSQGNFAVIVGCILGAGLLNKGLFVLEMPQAWAMYGIKSLAFGQTIVGGLIGGLIGVEIAKKIVGITHSTGDMFVLPFCLGLMVGRIGCFLAGLHDGTFGVATSLPWAIDFGDGIPRHPTQLYDMFWCIAMLILIKINYPKWQTVAGFSFKVMFASYLAWRLWVDGLKPIPHAYWLGGSAIQWACAIVLMGYLPFLLRDGYRVYQRH